MCPGRGKGMTRNLALWEVDPFYAAAEDVQDSADRLESAYRNWMHSRGLAKACPNDVAAVNGDAARHRELLTALDTVKWQLEEFEKAVEAETDVYVGEGSSVRRNQFVQAIHTQLKGVEQALPDTYHMNSEQSASPSVEDRDSFADFLSGCRGIQGTVISDVRIHPLPDEQVQHTYETTGKSESAGVEHIAPLPSVENGHCVSSKSTQIQLETAWSNGGDDHIVEICEDRPPYVGVRRSSSMGNGLDSKRGRNGYSGHHRRNNSVSNGSNWWNPFGGHPHYPGNKLLATNSGFKRWKDGDATILQQCNNMGSRQEDIGVELELRI
ncbi:hypothetical protein CY35_16G062100 [Sphagnum magellanicum]|nr:hypothetical protein CY35_16G062100 [Sphagnum magellanicum]KAH9537595.1 hypothetical protein CY35_16G062100 [Sphagnum magellanicum]